MRYELLGFRPAYTNAFTRRLAERYREERDRVTRKEATNSSTALVRVNRAEAAVNAFMEEKREKKIYKNAAGLTRNRYSSHAEGHRKGTEAADRIDLRGNKGINTTDQKKIS